MRGLPQRTARSVPLLLSAAAVLAAVSAGPSAARVLDRKDLAAPETSASAPQLAPGASGEVVAVWLEHRGDDAVAVAGTRASGGDWAAPVALSAPGQDAGDVRLASNARGDAIATWQRSDGINLQIQASL